ncbi:hypothetical protein EVAR_7330_1 [Eumeta japonica]|uniref:Uncharacterized protein n=1 Tax=Eumeta variegata TaxID=151549 RepID=A0A4C1T5K7_EUMVA|nr:hypothetical protein EVAR_7330_1 [Eumeta japonica]
MLLAGILVSFTVRGRTTHGGVAAHELPCGGSPRKSLEHQHGLGPFCYGPNPCWCWKCSGLYRRRCITPSSVRPTGVPPPAGDLPSSHLLYKNIYMI